MRTSSSRFAARQAPVDFTDLLDATIEEWIENSNQHRAPEPNDRDHDPGDEKLLLESAIS